MSISIRKINKTSAETKSKISRKSAQTLPNNPSGQGYSAEEIKRRFYQPIIDATNSAISEVDRVVDEVNDALDHVGSDFNNFIDSAEIKEAYRLSFGNDNWIWNDALKIYEVFISQNEHKIDNPSKIGVDTFLLDGDGKYVQVNQFDILLNGTIRCYHESNGAGNVTIYEKREGFVLGQSIVDVNNIEGIAKVAITNDYNDLDNIPNTDLSKANEIKIAEIIHGEQEVGMAKNAEFAESATYARNCSSAENATMATTATNADRATKALQDNEGNEITTTYAKATGSYSQMSVGSADVATKDSSGQIIKDTYAKTTGTYSGLSVGHADNASKATYDSEGNNISSTYAKQKDISVGKKEILIWSGEAELKNLTTKTISVMPGSGNSAKVATYRLCYSIAGQEANASIIVSKITGVADNWVVCHMIPSGSNDYSSSNYLSVIRIGVSVASGGAAIEVTSYEERLYFNGSGMKVDAAGTLGKSVLLKEVYEIV